jgi:phytoene dehydrogenase-like protein
MAVGDDVRRFDAVIVGNALGGLTAAAILANKGYRVAVVDQFDHPGGRVGSTEYQGYWIEWGHRDGHGIGDVALFPMHADRAAELAGVDLGLKPFFGTDLKIHFLPDGRIAQMPADMLIATDTDPFELAREACRLLGGVTEDLDGVAKEMLEVMGGLVQTPDDEAWNLVPVRMGDWLIRNCENPVVRNVVLQQFECVPFTPAADTSVGRFIFHSKRVHGTPMVPDDEEVGGVQGLNMPWLRRIREKGGELWFGWKPLEILVDEAEVKGVVAVNENQFVQVFEAPIVITDWFGWRLPELLDESALPEGFLDRANATARYQADGISWWAGLKRPPRRRADGKEEDFGTFWHRVLYGSGSVRLCHGGWYFPSSFMKRSAPPGKHLLCAEIVAHGEGGRRWRRWTDAKRAIDINLAYLHEYYADLDECIEWAHYQYVTPPQYLSWYIKPIYRHPVKVSTIDGLYVASSSSESLGSWIDAECAAALEAVDLAEAERGHLRGRA